MTEQEILKQYGFDNPKLHILNFDSEEDWLEQRKTCIGGSDVGAILGLNHYKSALQVYKEKVDNNRQNLSGNVYIKKGNDLESLVRSKYVAEYAKEYLEGRVVKHPNFIIYNEDYPWLHINLDGVLVLEDDFLGVMCSETILNEIKFVSEWAEQTWFTDDEYQGIPASYYAQVQTYMLVTGINKTLISPLMDKSWTVKHTMIYKDEEFINLIIRETKQFFNYNMNYKIPPALNTELDKEDIVEKLEENQGFKAVTPSEDFDNKVAEYLKLENEIKELDKIKSKYKDEIVNLHLQGHVSASNLNIVSVSKFTTSRFDTTAFKKANEAMYKDYLKESESLKITIKRKK